MRSFRKLVVYTAATITLASIAVRQATGGDWYTKYQVVEQVESPMDHHDPLAAAGFYEGNTVTETVTRNEFRFGLLPTPAGILDKHLVSVISIVAPLWVFALAILWQHKRH